MASNLAMPMRRLPGLRVGLSACWCSTGREGSGCRSGQVLPAEAAVRKGRIGRALALSSTGRTASGEMSLGAARTSACATDGKELKGGFGCVAFL